MKTSTETPPVDSTTTYRDRFSGIGRLFGREALKRLEASHVAVVGIGGVGSWTAEALARSGVGEITLIDLDDVCVTNVNRQLHAIDDQIGRMKVAAMADRIARIHEGCQVHEVAEFFTASNAGRLLEPGFDCVVDAIDGADHKCVLITACVERKIPIVVAGGAGGKSDPSKIDVADLFFATNDPLLKRVRKKLRADYGFPPESRKELFGIPTVFSTENAVYPWADGTVCEDPDPDNPLRLNCESGFGTASFVTGSFGFAAAAEAVKLVVGE